MKAPLLIITILAQVCIVALGAISYDGLVLTSIDVEAVPNTERTVRFSGSIAGRVDDETATFLENVRQINDTDESGKRLFEAETVTVARAREIINEGVQGGGGKPLFCIHGWSIQPGQHLQDLQAAGKKFDQGKFTLVPVIWPTRQGIFNYLPDQETSAAGAGKAFMTLKKGINNFPSKSLLCHSMGNFVLRNAAFEKFKFDNIFMVAADVRYDLFNKDYIRGGDEPERKDGVNICKMISNPAKGKVHILWNPLDAIIFLSLVANGVQRIGATGVNDNLIDDDCKGFVVNKNVRRSLRFWEIAAHEFQFNDFAIKYYEDQHF
jgi:hypothetical protein